LNVVRGFRGVLLVPLVRDRATIGMISVTRKEPGRFAAHHVQLLQTFADQAVIAIGNVRLFEQVQARTRDLSESLQQQTATSEVLKVISRSAFDLQTVLDTLVESAVTLCGARTGTIFLESANLYHLASNYGYSPDMLAYGRANPIAPGIDSNVGRVALQGGVVHIPDVLADPDYRASGYQRIGNYRAMLGVPVLRDGKVEGVLSLARPEPGPFTQRQIELVQTFADQAVIAIENARLFEEVQARTEDLRESLQQQTATADVLKVISRSAFDLDSVLTTLVTSAATLCEAEKGVIFLRDDDVFRLVANYGFSAEFEAFARANPFPVDGGTRRQYDKPCRRVRRRGSGGRCSCRSGAKRDRTRIPAARRLPNQSRRCPPA
jgi:GAF domain-containing protein